MNSLKDTALESNPYFKINFDGGDLSSDAGLLLIKEFAEKIGLVKLVYRLFKTNDDALFRIHIDPENLLQVIYQTMAAYFEDDCADELTVDPVFTAILGKDALASQPTLSRFYNRMDETTLKQFAIKEGKDGFDFSAVSSQSKIVNANRLQMHGLAYNLFNWFRRLALAASMRKQRIDTVRLKLMKIAARVVRSARYTTFKLCSSCPYKDEFYETLRNIQGLRFQLE